MRDCSCQVPVVDKFVVREHSSGVSCDTERVTRCRSAKFNVTAAIDNWQLHDRVHSGAALAQHAAVDKGIRRSRARTRRAHKWPETHDRARTEAVRAGQGNIVENLRERASEGASR